MAIRAPDRTDDSRRGGDFDFYVETDLDDADAVIEAKLELLVELHAHPAFEEERIDLIVKPALQGPYPPVYQVARREGVPPVKLIETVGLVAAP